MKTIVNSVSIVRPEGHPVFDCIQAGIDSEGAGTFLRITGHDELNDSATIGLDWEEWDALVETVNEHRNEWEIK